MENLKELSLEELELINGGSFGKCLAGIGGGAVSEGTTGFLGGAAVGTVTIPIIRTIAGIKVSAIGGTIEGGLTGAAGFCFD